MSDIEELIATCRQLAEWVDNPNDSLKETILSRHDGKASVYVQKIADLVRQPKPTASHPFAHQLGLSLTVDALFGIGSSETGIFSLHGSLVGGQSGFEFGAPLGCGRKFKITAEEIVEEENNVQQSS